MPNNLSLREKIGQMIITGLPGTTVSSEFRRLVEVYKIGNVILFSRNCDTVSQISELCSQLQELIRTQTGTEAFIAVDQEGGMVTRIPKDGTTFSGAMAITASGQPQNARLAGKLTGEELRAMGINMNLAPVLDINCNPDNPVIGVRSFGDNSRIVSDFGIQMLQGLIEGGVMPVVKHFPGHGDTAMDSHLSLPVIPKSMDQLAQNELIPFQEAIQRGAPCVMTAHILFPDVEIEKIPATLSRTIVTGLLKEKLGFHGLIMTDCMEMSAIQEYYGTASGAVQAIKAGVHLVTVSHTPHLVEATVKAIEQAVMTGELPERMLDEAVQKVMEFKKRTISRGEFSPQSIGSAEHRHCARRISEESITWVHCEGEALFPLDGQSLFLGCNASRINLASDRLDEGFSFPDYMSSRLGGTGLLTSLTPSEEERASVIEMARNFDHIILGLYNGHIYREQVLLANELVACHSKVTIVALRNPYDIGLIKTCKSALAIYEYTPLAFDALCKVLRGEISPKGTLPVNLKIGG